MKFGKQTRKLHQLPEQSVIVGCQKIGWVRGRYLDDGTTVVYHAALEVPNGSSSVIDSNNLTLVQGHGETKEAAVEDALTENLEKFSCLVKEITKLQQEIRDENVNERI